jgi:hypothetical protein
MVGKLSLVVTSVISNCYQIDGKEVKATTWRDNLAFQHMVDTADEMKRS